VAPRWQLIVSEKMPAELYDWSADPQELHNLASDPAESALAGELNTELWSEVQPHGAAVKVQSAIPKTANSSGTATR